VKILTISNLYPPHYLGGYELACQDVAEALAARGHEVRILTSSHGMPGPVREGAVARILEREYPPRADWKAERRASAANVAHLGREVRDFAPEVIHVFNPSGLTGAFLSWLHAASPCPVVHDISDLWLPNAYAEDTWGAFARRSRLRAVLARLLGPATGAPPDFSRSYYRSDFLRRWHREHGLDPAGAGVIHHGVRLDTVARWNPSARGVVFAGRLSPDKGVHVLLEAIRDLAARRQDLSFPVSILGAGDEAYVASLRAIVGAIPERIPVEFAGTFPRDEALRRVADHAVYAFPVVWDEPFSIGLVEALAAGMPVVATRTGGTGEIVVEGRNGLLVERDDAAAFGKALEALLDDPSERERLSLAARGSVEHLDFPRTIDRIEAHLAAVVGS